MKAFARFALLLLALSSVSCATGGMTPVSNPMPAARAGLLPQYRIFYDALADYGEWTLIEPLGYVFHPNVSAIGWSPYAYGFWVPNDAFGWVWISSEPFGWATYHYGQWLYDRYEGWVWVPGIDWGPSWVDWQTNGDYVGWSPQLAPGTQSPGDTWHYVALNQMTSTDLTGRVLTRDEAVARSTQAQFQPIRNLAKVNGVTINRGPALELVERKTGPLQYVKISQIETGPAPAPSAPSGTPGVGRGAPTPLVEAARRAAEAARDAKRIAENGAPAPREVPLVRLIPPRPGSGTGGGVRRAPPAGPAPSDTTQH